METTSAKTRKKKRYENFTEQEKEFLLLHVQKYKDIIEKKDTNLTCCKQKKKAWSAIAEIFSQQPNNTKRTAQQLQTLFRNLKAKRKKELVEGASFKICPKVDFEKIICKKSSSDTEDNNIRDEFSDDKDDSNDDFSFTNDDNDDDIDNLVSSTLPVDEPKVKLQPMKTNFKKLEYEKTLYDLKIEEAEIRLMIANEQLEEAKIQKLHATLVQQYEIKYYEEKIRALNNIHSGSQFIQ